MSCGLTTVSAGILDGSFKEAYCDWEFDQAQLAELALPEVQVTTWGGCAHQWTWMRRRLKYARC